MIQLSKRLQAVAHLVGDAAVLADVGTDHGYIPVFLTMGDKVKGAIAMDVNPGPLQRAQEHIRQYSMEERVETRLSDGLSALIPGEADTIVIAGMGGALMTRILIQGEAVARTARKLVLQPQSDIYAFRCFLTEHGYRIVAEDMVYEDGKFYPMMAVEPADGETDEFKEAEQSALKYGPLLLEKRHPVLRQFLLRRQEQNRKILENLNANARQDVAERKAQVASELAEIEKVLELWKEQVT